MTLQRKLVCLKRIISGYRSCVVAFSGGQDSAFLLKICSLVLPKANILAVTAISATYPKDELRKAEILVKDIGVKLKIIKTAELDNKKFRANSIQRCYFCKKELFSKLIVIARQNKLNFVLDASNISDKKDYRPGNIAKRELKIKSPLLEAGFSKKDICKISKMLGLSSWNKPPLACLASRIPYGTKITAGLLRRIDQAEAYLVNLGFRQVRLRHHNGLCRIEVEKKYINRLLRKRQAIVDKLKNLGYNYITLDLEGYRTGSLNEVINEENIS
ncbi:MAG: ATP-dependent sacrificial sulfur transferase LarE [Candidatus Omnitrophica bacterium]|nr:ATP-dependent sacrificial sulfur transferase LarE [Candidatus Omnitrophota bacterium]MBU1923138.1 ATP-dependent sacrificial sulfur transferase LarE [Candidatus Omnitrophota bacterium]